MYIVSLHYKRSLEEIDRHLEAHNAYLKDQYARGRFILSGRKEPRTGGVIIARSLGREELESILEEDPFRKSGLVDYEITEFVPVMVADGCEALMEAPRPE